MRLVIEVEIPDRGDKPSEFRRAFAVGTRDAAVKLHFEGKLDADLVEEIFRAVSVE